MNKQPLETPSLARCREYVRESRNRALTRIAGLAFLAIMPCTRATAAALPTSELSRSIVNEARQGRTGGTQTSSSAVYGAIMNAAQAIRSQTGLSGTGNFTGTGNIKGVGNVAGVGNVSGVGNVTGSGTDFSNPTVESLLPSVPVQLADGRVSAVVAPASSSLTYNGERQRFNLSLGFGYYKHEKGRGWGTGHLDLATMLGDRLALGSSITLFDYRTDLLFNAVWQAPGSPIRFKASCDYLTGSQEFGFLTGEEKVKLDQYGWTVGGSWIAPDESEDGWLQSLGLSVWGAKANQITKPGSAFFSRDISGTYYVYEDLRLLSEGELLGFSGDAQIALAPSLVSKGSLGYERLTFPFYDGTKDRNTSLYADLGLYWSPVRDLTLGAAAKKGASEDRYTLSAGTGNWKIDTWYSKGANGITSDKGAMLTYTLALSGGGSDVSLAKRMKPARNSASSSMIGDALERSSHLPTTFLAKVDPTAVRLAVTVDKSTLPQGDTDGSVNVDIQGDLHILVGDGVTPTINEVRLNGAPFNYTGIMGTAANEVVVNTGMLTQAGLYVISATDGSGTTYGIEINAE
jgi:hypothetical protein